MQDKYQKIIREVRFLAQAGQKYQVSWRRGQGLVVELPLQAGAQSRGGGEQKNTMISGGKVQLKIETEQKKKGGERGACVRIREKPRLNKHYGKHN